MLLLSKANKDKDLTAFEGPNWARVLIILKTVEKARLRPFFSHQRPL
jgi:hypothetical protein